MRKPVRSSSLLVSLLLLASLFPGAAMADQQSVSIGYGLGILNNDAQIGHLWYNGYYDFAQVNYGYEKQLSGKINLLLEPFAAFINRPTAGLDVGFGLSAKYYFGSQNHRGFFVTAGTGAVYTTLNFEEQGTHGLFILQGGIGYQWKELFVESRLRHYSNAGLASPNKSVNASTFNVGYAF